MTVARLGLVVVAVAQLAVCVPVLLFGHDRSAPVHVAHEMGSFEVAVAIGFLVAARRPGRAMGMLSLMGAAAGLLVLTATLDLVAGRTGLSDEAPHLLVVAGWLLLRWLATVAPPTWERPHTALAVIDAGRAVWTERRVRPRGRQPPGAGARTGPRVRRYPHWGQPGEQAGERSSAAPRPPVDMLAGRAGPQGHVIGPPPPGVTAVVTGQAESRS